MTTGGGTSDSSEPRAASTNPDATAANASTGDGRRGGDASGDSYDELASLYATHADESPWNRWYERPNLRRLIEGGVALADARVLDAGCAGGGGMDWLAERAAHVVGVDVSQPMLGLAKRRLGSSASLVAADLDRSLPLIDDSFDLVVCSLTLHYLTELSAALGEFARVLRPGGVLALSTHHPMSELGDLGLVDYYSTGTVEDRWRISGHPRSLWIAERFWLEMVTAWRARRLPSVRAARPRHLTVRYQRRTLSQLFNAVSDAGFVIERVGEPLPSEELRGRFPTAAAKLETVPGFLFVRARLATTAEA